MIIPDQRVTVPADSRDALEPAAAARPDAGGRRRLLDRPVIRVLLGLILPVIILAAWQAVTVTGLVPAYRLPTPASVVAAGIDLAQRGELGTHVAISVQRVLSGFAIGGWLMAKSHDLAQRHVNDDREFYQSKQQIVRAYMEQILPQAHAMAAIVKSGAGSIVEADPELF